MRRDMCFASVMREYSNADIGSRSGFGGGHSAQLRCSQWIARCLHVYSHIPLKS